MTKPLIRWVKGPGRADLVTRQAIAQATRLFGSEVDYALSVNGELTAERVRFILSGAEQPVEVHWQQVSENQLLDERLRAAGVGPDWIGTFWKHFPSRLRLDAPEWLMDADIVLVGRPPWFSAWVAGSACARMPENVHERQYGQPDYFAAIETGPHIRMNNGMIVMPPALDLDKLLLRFLDEHPLDSRYTSGPEHLREQGVVVGALTNYSFVCPIPMRHVVMVNPEDDVARASDHEPPTHAWGYHFLRAEVMRHRLAAQMLARGELGPPIADDPILAHRWLAGLQTPLQARMIHTVARAAAEIMGGRALDLGTYRGYTAVLLALAGCTVTTVDIERLADQRLLDGLGIEFVTEPSIAYMARCDADLFDLVLLDTDHTPETTAGEWPEIKRVLKPGGYVILHDTIIDNVRPEWTGPRWIWETQLDGWERLHFDQWPGLGIARKPSSTPIRAVL